MKRLLSMVALLVVLSACGTDSADRNDKSGADSQGEKRSSAAATAAFEEWYTAMNEGDCAGVKSRVTQPDLIDCDEVLEGKGEWNDLKVFTTKSLNVTLIDESAVVHLTDKSGEQSRWDMEWVDKRWLLVSDADDA